jgi:hypothetical protein
MGMEPATRPGTIARCQSPPRWPSTTTSTRRIAASTRAIDGRDPNESTTPARTTTGQASMHARRQRPRSYAPLARRCNCSRSISVMDSAPCRSQTHEGSLSTLSHRGLNGSLDRTQGRAIERRQAADDLDHRTFEIPSDGLVLGRWLAVHELDGRLSSLDATPYGSTLPRRDADRPTQSIAHGIVLMRSRHDRQQGSLRRVVGFGLVTQKRPREAPELRPQTCEHASERLPITVGQARHQGGELFAFAGGHPGRGSVDQQQGQSSEQSSQQGHPAAAMERVGDISDSDMNMILSSMGLVLSGIASACRVIRRDVDVS